MYALASAHIAAILLNWREDSLILRQRIRNKKTSSPTFGKVVRIARILVVVGAFILVDLISIISSYVNNVMNSTSYTAHGSGVVMGLLVGLIILKNRRVEHWETWLRISSCCLAVLLLIVFLILNIVLDQNVKSPEIECDYFLL